MDSKNGIQNVRMRRRLNKVQKIEMQWMNEMVG